MQLKKYKNILGKAKIQIEITEAENVFYHDYCVVCEATRNLFQNLNVKCYIKKILDSTF